MLERQDGVCDSEDLNDKLELLTGESVAQLSEGNKRDAEENFFLTTGELTAVDGLVANKVEFEVPLDVAVVKEGVEVDDAMFDVPFDVVVVKEDVEEDEAMKNIFYSRSNYFSRITEVKLLYIQLSA